MKQLSIFAISFLIFTAGAWTQGSTASVTGTVHDASGAVVPNAKVQITNVATGVVKGTATNQAGIYFVPDLIPGTYNINVNVTGFRRTEVGGMKLEIDQKADVDIALVVGSVNEEVTVTTAPAALQTEDASVGAVVQSQTVQDMPLNGRYYTQLLQLVPGAALSVRNPNYGSTSAPELNGKERNGTPAFAVDGGSGSFTMFLIDGDRKCGARIRWLQRPDLHRCYSRSEDANQQLLGGIWPQQRAGGSGDQVRHQPVSWQFV